MKLTLAENIRQFRKQRKLTQEKLAEALGVTVGAVYKWESGLSQPELNMVVELADFFDTSVDVLLGYRIKDNTLEAAKERIMNYCRKLDPMALNEAEKTLGKYPNSFAAVHGCAMVYLVFGAATHEEPYLRRSLELLERSKELLSQNEDPRISEATIAGDLSNVWFLLGEKDKSIELLKQNNVGGIYSGDIGTFLSIWKNDPEEAVVYLSEALTDGITTLISAVAGYVFLFRHRGDWNSAMDILVWSIGLLEGLKTNQKENVLEKAHAEMLALLSYVQAKKGMKKESSDTLQQAYAMAVQFDSLPDYSLDAMRFADQNEPSLAFDLLDAGALESIAELIRLLNDQRFLKEWKEIRDEEQ